MILLLEKVRAQFFAGQTRVSLYQLGHHPHPWLAPMGSDLIEVQRVSVDRKRNLSQSLRAFFLIYIREIHPAIIAVCYWSRNFFCELKKDGVFCSQ